MTPLDEVLECLRLRDDCLFHPASCFPKIPTGLQLPADLTEFYRRYSEALLFCRRDMKLKLQDSRCHVLPPNQFVQIGKAILNEETTAVQASWFSLADVQDGNYFAIDLAPSRLGRCYDCFHESFEPADCKIIALSFTELLNRFAEAGDDCWWLAEGFQGYGYGNS